MPLLTTTLVFCHRSQDSILIVTNSHRLKRSNKQVIKYKLSDPQRFYWKKNHLNYCFDTKSISHSHNNVVKSRRDNRRRFLERARITGTLIVSEKMASVHFISRSKEFLFLIWASIPITKDQRIAARPTSSLFKRKMNYSESWKRFNWPAIKKETVRCFFY